MDFPGDRDGPLLRAEPPSGHPGAWVEPQAHPTHRPPGDSRSDAVGCGQHPLGVDQGAPAVVPPVPMADSQAHLPGPPAPRGLLPPDEARALQGLAWGWSRKPSTLGSSEPTTRPWACGGGGGQRPCGPGVRTHQGLQRPGTGWGVITPIFLLGPGLDSLSLQTALSQTKAPVLSSRADSRVLLGEEAGLPVSLYRWHPS